MIRCSRRSSVAVSSHCKSSRNSASGCSFRANTPRKRRTTIWKRRGASCGGRAGDEDQRGSAVGGDAVEGRQQGVDLTFPRVQPLRDQQTVRRILPTERKRVDPPERPPCGKAPPKISLDPGRGLVAILCGLG